MLGRTWVVLSLSFLLTGITSQAVAAPRKKAAAEGPPAASASDPACGALLVESTELSDFAHFYQIYKLTDLVQADPAHNLAVKHPTIAMNAYQFGWSLIKHYGYKTILEPNYRVERVPVWNIFATPVGNGVQVIEQYRGANEVVTFLREGASGSSAAKVLGLNGPAGTGKTEMLKAMHLRRAHLSMENPRFYEFRFRWKDLHKIPSLEPLQERSQWGQPYPHQMGRSPIVLLPKSLQARVAQLANPAVKELTGFEARPFGAPDPQTKQIIEEIIHHHFPTRPPTEAEYLETLSQYVEIIRFVVDPEQPPVFVRNQGKDVEWENLTMSENLFTKAIYGPGNPLSYNYSGLLLRADGFGLLFDEFWRNTVPFRDINLDLAQNRVIQRGGAPAVQMNTFVMFADNDESIGRAKEESAAGAQIDRMVSIPMRMPIHPHIAAKVALHMAMQEWGPHKFTMEKLGDKRGPRVPLDINVVFPEPSEEGEVVGPDGRYAMFCRLGTGAEILIAPRTLYLIGLTAAASRLVTDPRQLVKHLREFDMLKPGANEFTHPITRLQIILGQLPATEAIRSELTKVQALLKEGSVGISPRSVQTWLLLALQAAEANQNTLTPALLAASFEKALDNDKIRFNNDESRATWVTIHEQMKSGMLLPTLVEDVLTLLSQKVDLDNLYGDVQADLIALSRDPKALTREDAGKQVVNINLKRIEQLKEIYYRLNGRDLDPGEVANFKLRVSYKPEDRHPALLKALQTWRYESELDSLALDQYLTYFSTSNGSEEVRRRADRAKQEMLTQGYNMRALLEAMSMARDILHEQEQRRQKPE